MKHDGAVLQQNITSKLSTRRVVLNLSVNENNRLEHDETIEHRLVAFLSMRKPVLGKEDQGDFATC